MVDLNAQLKRGERHHSTVGDSSLPTQSNTSDLWQARGTNTRSGSSVFPDSTVLSSGS